MGFVVVFVFGLVFGSFLNVCIARLPRGESIVAPRSECPHCGRRIRWYDNVPVVGYILLRGRCRDCRRPISAVYPLVELLTAFLVLAAFTRLGPTAAFLKQAALIMLLIVVVFTDLKGRTIPHPVTIFGITLGLAFSLIVPVNSQPLAWLGGRAGLHPVARLASLGASLLGALVGGGLFYAVGEIFYRVRHKEGLGFGDVMLMLMVGAFLGAPLTLLTVLLGSLLGIVVALLLTAWRRRFRNYAWPYGTFLGIAAIGASFEGKLLLHAYLRWSGLE